MRISENLYMVGSEQFGLSHLLDCNCYLIDHGQGLALIDTGLGLGVTEILENIHREGLNPKELRDIVITHTHLGHWGGAPELREKTGATIWAPETGRYWMEHVKEDQTIWQNLEFGRWPKTLNPQSCTPDKTFTDGDKIKLGNRELGAILVRGHTIDSTCLCWESHNRRALFTGDVVFYAGTLGIINAPGSSLDDYRHDMNKLANMKIDMMFPGHSVFILKNGQKHIDRAIRKLHDFVLPDTFFEPNEFMWESDYRSSLEDSDQ